MDVASIDPLVAVSLLCNCGSFFHLNHLALSSPAALTLDAFSLFNEDVLCWFHSVGLCMESLSCKKGGRSICPLSHHHASSAFISCLSVFICFFFLDPGNVHLANALWHFNTHVSPKKRLPSPSSVPHTISKISSFPRLMISRSSFFLIRPARPRRLGC